MVSAMSGIYEFSPDDARRFAREYGFKVRERGKELQFRKCPYCQNNTDDKNTFSINLETGQYKCLRASCGAHGNMITLARDFNFSLGAETDEYYSPSRRYRRYPRTVLPDSRPEAVKYLESRGISESVTNAYKITTKKDDDKILVFPFLDETELLTFIKYRKTDFDPQKDKSKEWCEANSKPILFGMHLCKDISKPLVLTEGQIDSLSVAEAGIENAVSVPTGAKGFTWIPYCWNFLLKFKTLIVFGDHENGRITLLDEMKKRFPGTIKHVRPEDYRGCKDANEILQRHGKKAVRHAVENADIVRTERIVPVSSIKRRDLSKLERFNSGFVSLNRTIGGLFLGQLVLLTGERGDGKSTLASQFGLMAVNAGYNTMFYSGELLDWNFRDWFDRQAAGAKYLFRRDDEFGNANWLVRSSDYDRLERWYENKAFWYEDDVDDAESQETLLETIDNGIRQYGCRVFVLDNLMTAMEDDLSNDIYRQQSVFVRSLSRIAKKKNVLIILIAHPKKRGAYDFSNDDVAGSANVTNLCDVVLRYTRPKEDDTKDVADPPDRLLQVWKNRLTGKLNKEGIKLYYEESSKRISEDSGNFDLGLTWDEDPESTDDFVEASEDEVPFDFD